jgi:hypothetical protein
MKLTVQGKKKFGACDTSKNPKYLSKDLLFSIMLLAFAKYCVMLQTHSVF